MAVSKHNLWKRKKNGVMKLVRSHSDWLVERREKKMRELGRKRGETPVNSSQWWQKDTGVSAPLAKLVKSDTPKSTKRTQVGKKI